MQNIQDPQLPVQMYNQPQLEAIKEEAFEQTFHKQDETIMLAESKEEEEYVSSPRINQHHQQNDNHQMQHKFEARGPYLNPLRTSHEQQMRLSYQKEQNKANEHIEKEKTFTVEEISKHSYFKKSRINKYGDTASNETIRNATVKEEKRYNPVKFLLAPSSRNAKFNDQIEEDEEDPDEKKHNLPVKAFANTGGLNNQLKATIKQQSIVPEQMTSRDNIYSNIQNKVDGMKHSVHEMKQSYLDTIKEESDTRRTNFYRSNIAHIYNGSGVGTSLQAMSNQEQLAIQDDRQSVKSDNTYDHTPILKGQYPSKLIGAKNLPLLPRAREIQLSNPTLPDNVLLQEEKLRQQQNLRMQTRLHFLQQKESQKQSYFNARTQSLTQHITQQQSNQQQQTPIKGAYSQRASPVDHQFELGRNRSISPQIARDQFNTSSLLGNGNYQIYQQNRLPQVVDQRFAHYGETNNTIDYGKSFKVGGPLEEFTQSRRMVEGRFESREELINKYKYKGGPNKFEETTKTVLANATERRRIL